MLLLEGTTHERLSKIHSRALWLGFFPPFSLPYDIAHLFLLLLLSLFLRALFSLSLSRTLSLSSSLSLPSSLSHIVNRKKFPNDHLHLHWFFYPFQSVSTHTMCLSLIIITPLKGKCFRTTFDRWEKDSSVASERA